MKIPVYIVTLDQNDSRAMELTNRLTTLRIPFHYIEAVDGRKLDLEHFEGYDAKSARGYMGRELVGGEIGCYLSHLKAAKAFLDSGSEIAIVLEDDAVVQQDFMILCAEISTNLNLADPDWLLVNIGNSSRKITSKIGKLSTNSHVLKAAHYFPMTTHGLLWSRQGAQAFVDRHQKIWAPVDNYTHYWLTREGHGYTVHPPVVGVSGADSVISTSASLGNRGRHNRTLHFGFLKQKRLMINKYIALRKKLRFSLTRQGRAV